MSEVAQQKLLTPAEHQEHFSSIIPAPQQSLLVLRSSALLLELGQEQSLASPSSLPPPPPPQNSAANPDSSLQLPAELGFWDSSELSSAVPAQAPRVFLTFIPFFLVQARRDSSSYLSFEKFELSPDTNPSVQEQLTDSSLKHKSPKNSLTNPNPTGQ